MNNINTAEYAKETILSNAPRYMQLFTTKFNYGDIVYLLKQQAAQVPCSFCNGTGTLHIKESEVEIKCPMCRGSGKQISNDVKIWHVVEEPMTIEQIRILANSPKTYSVKYTVKDKSGIKHNPASINICATKEEAQAECDKRNRPTKKVDISEIIINPDFNYRKPSPDKVKDRYEYYSKNGVFDKDIVVDKDNVLIEGYVTYLICKMFGINNVKVFIES